MNMSHTEIMNITTMQTDEIEEYIFGFRFCTFDDDWERNKIIRESQNFLKDPYDKTLLSQPTQKSEHMISFKHFIFVYLVMCLMATLLLGYLSGSIACPDG